LNTWKRIAEMLEAYRQQQKSAWGDTDDVVIAKYLSGTCSAEEKAAVEQAAKGHKALAELLHVLRDVATAPLPGPERTGAWIPGPVARLVEGLVAWLDEAGRVAADGLKSVLDIPEPAFAGAMKLPGAASRTGEAIWTVPLPDPGGWLTLTAAPGESPGLWTLMIAIDLFHGAAHDPEARLEISDEQGEEELAGPLGNFLNKLIVLKEGAWQVKLRGVSPSDLLLPVTLGPSRSGSSP